MIAKHSLLIILKVVQYWYCLNESFVFFEVNYVGGGRRRPDWRRPSVRGGDRERERERSM
jgi:hypothetical protein